MKKGGVDVFSPLPRTFLVSCNSLSMPEAEVRSLTYDVSGLVKRSGLSSLSGRLCQNSWNFFSNRGTHLLIISSFFKVFIPLGADCGPGLIGR